jgi:hypothetical protein
MIQKFAIVVLALSLSAVSANAMTHHMMHKRMAMCAGGQVAASCMCGAKGAKLQACKAGQWCHPERAACTQ